MPDSTQTKVCTRCAEEKPRAEFYRRSASADGLQDRCKPCDRAMQVVARKAKLSSRAVARKAERKLAATAARLALGVKDCSACGATKPLSEFFKRESALDGFVESCSDCQRATRRKSYRNNRETAQAAMAAWRDNNRSAIADLGRRRRQLPEVRLARRDAEGQRRARMRHQAAEPVDLAALWTGSCGICGAAIDSAAKYPDPMSKSVDHIVPLALGGSHEQSNLQWSHLRCNTRKGARRTA